MSPLLPPPRVHQAWTRRREKLRTRPRRPRTHRRATRRRRRRRARPPRRRRRRRRRPRPRPRRPRRRPAFGSAHVSQRPQCALARHEPPRNSRLFVCRAYTGRAAPSVPGNDKPTGLDHAGLDAGGARLRRARLGLVRAGRPPELPGADSVYQFLNVSDLELTHATQEGITLRVLLSRLLNCQPMRVSKKYSGEAPRGNQTSGARRRLRNWRGARRGGSRRRR